MSCALLSVSVRKCRCVDCILLLISLCGVLKVLGFKRIWGIVENLNSFFIICDLFLMLVCSQDCLFFIILILDTWWLCMCFSALLTVLVWGNVGVLIVLYYYFLCVYLFVCCKSWELRGLRNCRRPKSILYHLCDFFLMLVCSQDSWLCMCVCLFLC